MAQAGDVLADKYRLVRLIGEGGMGSVFEANHERIGKRVAVKLVRSEHAENQEIVGRFSREAQAAASIGHPGIIDVYDIGTAADGSLFLVMEYLEGQSLGAALDVSGALDPGFTAYIGCQILSALDSAHRKGIVHRDLKPDNVYLVDTWHTQPAVKILDFGISKFVTGEGEDNRMTRSGVVMGTPYYMSPEQARGRKDVDQRADLWATGVILYECLTGQRPFAGGNLLALVYEVLNTEPPPPTSIRPGLSPAFESVVLRALVRDRDARYSSAAEMLADLIPHVDDSARGQLTTGKMIVVSASSGDAAMAATPPRPAPPTAITPPEAGVASHLAPPPTMTPAGLLGGDASASGMTPSPRLATDMAWQSGMHSEIRPVPPRRTGLIVGTIVGVIIVIGGGLGGIMAWVVGGDEPATSPTPELQATSSAPALPSIAPRPATIAPPAIADPEPALVVVSLEGVPEGARVFCDGELVASHRMGRPPSEEPHELRVELEGYESWRETTIFDRDRSILVTLRPVAQQVAVEAERVEQPVRSSTSRRAAPEVPPVEPPPAQVVISPPSMDRRPGQRPRRRFRPNFE